MVENVTFTQVPLGLYTVSESSLPINITDIALDNLTCDDGASTTPSTTDIATRTATINLDPGEIVTCTFHNRQPFGTIKIIKSTNPPGETGFSFASPLLNPTSFLLEDQGEQTFIVLPGTYTV